MIWFPSTSTSKNRHLLYFGSRLASNSLYLNFRSHYRSNVSNIDFGSTSSKKITDIKFTIPRLIIRFQYAFVFHSSTSLFYPAVGHFKWFVFSIGFWSTVPVFSSTKLPLMCSSSWFPGHLAGNLFDHQSGVIKIFAKKNWSAKRKGATGIRTQVFWIRIRNLNHWMIAPKSAKNKILM